MCMSVYILPTETILIDNLVWLDDWVEGGLWLGIKN